MIGAQLYQWQQQLEMNRDSLGTNSIRLWWKKQGMAVAIPCHAAPPPLVVIYLPCILDCIP
jgi:hypothetical protein